MFVRALIVPILFAAACTDSAAVPASVVHINVEMECSQPECGFYPEVFYNYCGSISSEVITPATREVELVTEHEADKLAAFVQLQHTMTNQELVYTDQVLLDGESADVYSASDGLLLYRIDASGGVADIDTSKLTAASGNTLRFTYTTYDGATIREDHVIDAPLPLYVETDSPGIMDACCAVGSPRDAGLIVIVLGLVLRRRKPRRRWPTRDKFSPIHRQTRSTRSHRWKAHFAPTVVKIAPTSTERLQR